MGKITKIGLVNKSYRNDGLRAVKIEFDGMTDWTFLTIDELLKILELWIIGEELKYHPSNGCKGRWMLHEKIQEVFENTPVPDKSDFDKEFVAALPTNSETKNL